LPKPSGEQLELLYRISGTINSSLYLSAMPYATINECIPANPIKCGFLPPNYAEREQVFKNHRCSGQRNLKEIISIAEDENGKSE
jgi:hypothetical protein